MTTPVTAIQTTVDTKVCLGHEVHVKKCFSREEVREESAKVLDDYSKRVTVVSSKTHMIEKTEKRKLIGTKKIYDLYITFFHVNNEASCNHFKLQNEATKTEHSLEIDRFFDALEEPVSPSIASINSIRNELLAVLPELANA